MRTLALVFAATLFAAPVNRAIIGNVETSINKRIESLWPGEPYLLLGQAHGVYLEGYGWVFTARVNLAEGPGISPFRPQITDADKAALRKRKLERLPKLKTAMQEMMIAAAGAMDPLPANEKIVLSMLLFHLPYENTKDLPSQIVMEAPREALQAGLTGQKLKAMAAIAVKEF